MGGIDPYSASKASAEIVTKSIFESFFNKKIKVKIATVDQVMFLVEAIILITELFLMLKAINQNKNLIIESKS